MKYLVLIAIFGMGTVAGCCSTKTPEQLGYVKPAPKAKRDAVHRNIARVEQLALANPNLTPDEITRMAADIALIQSEVDDICPVTTVTPGG